MPEDGSKLAKVDVLADAAAQVVLAVPVKDMERLEPLLASTAGLAEAQIAFRRERGHVVARIQVHADLAVLCQRCLAPLVLPVSGDSDVALVESEAGAADVPGEFETARCTEGRMRLRELVEEELLLALPAAPVHEDGACGAVRGPEQDAADAPTQKPFAALGQMLGKARKN